MAWDSGLPSPCCSGRRFASLSLCLAEDADVVAAFVEPVDAKSQGALLPAGWHWSETMGLGISLTDLSQASQGSGACTEVLSSRLSYHPMPCPWESLLGSDAIGHLSTILFHPDYVPGKPFMPKTAGFLPPHPCYFMQPSFNRMTCCKTSCISGFSGIQAGWKKKALPQLNPLRHLIDRIEPGL